MFGVTFRLKYSGRNASYEITNRLCSKFFLDEIVAHDAQCKIANNIKTNEFIVKSIFKRILTNIIDYVYIYKSTIDC